MSVESRNLLVNISRRSCTYFLEFGRITLLQHNSVLHIDETCLAEREMLSHNVFQTNSQIDMSRLEGVASCSSTLIARLDFVN